MIYGPDFLLNTDGTWKGFVRAGDEIVPGNAVVLTVTPEALTCGCPKTKVSIRCPHMGERVLNSRKVTIK